MGRERARKEVRTGEREDQAAATSGGAPPRAALLLVDDEDDILESLSELFALRLPGLTVLTARSGEEALSVLRRERVDVIVSDYRMPGMDGIEFLRRARGLAPGVPRMLITAYGNRELAARAEGEAGVRITLPKPIDSAQLVRTTARLLEPPA